MTRTQRNTLDNIRAFFDAHGRAPTIRELMAIEGLKSTTAIHARLKALVRDGYLLKLDDPAGRYVPADKNIDAVLNSYSTGALQTELRRRMDMADEIDARARAS